MKRLLHILLLMFAVSSLYAQSEETNRILSYLQKAMNFNKVVPQEKVYLHFDNMGYFENNGNAYKGTNDFIKEVTGYLNYLCKGEAGKTLISDLVQRKEGISIVQDEMSGERERFSFRDDGIKSVVRFNPEQKVEGAKGGVVLGHELAHSQDRLNGTMLNEKWFDGQTKTVTISERYAMHWENLIRAEHGVVLRQYYADSDGRLYSNSKNECVSLYFDSKYPYNVNYKNVLPEGIKGYVYKSY